MKTAFYLVAALPAVIGIALIVLGIWVICRFKHNDAPSDKG